MRIIPSTDYAGPSKSLYAGLLIGMAPSTLSGYGIELQRTSDSGTGGAASSAAASIAELDPVALAGVPYFDELPADRQKRFYRARHIADGYTEGAWTAWTTGHLPVQLSEKDMRNATAQVTGYPSHRSISMTDDLYAVSAANSVGTQFSTNMYLPSTYTLNVGTTGTPSSITKTLKIPFGEFLPKSNTTKWDVGTGYLFNASTGGGSMLFYASAVLPAGVTITETGFRFYRDSPADTVTGTLYRLGDSGSVTTITQTIITGGGAGGYVTATDTAAETVGTDSYLVEIDLNSISATNQTRVIWYYITYTMPSYDKGY